MLTTRPACLDDAPFLLEVYPSTRQDEVAAWGWSPEQQNAFLQMQFMAQNRSYEMRFPDLAQRVIVQDGRLAGRLIAAQTGDEVRLVDIALLPEFRGTGIGATLIRELQAQAERVGKPLGLQVAKANPARRLYERLGFVVIGETDLHYAMEWRPAGSR
ncbi:MAG TPA: GNAT family N-acetyltransferase [Symbiobacteriaceae bacterium]|jgi:ribosomal protein S18 acetylase RimI-like enzyme